MGNTLDLLRSAVGGAATRRIDDALWLSILVGLLFALLVTVVVVVLRRSARDVQPSLLAERLAQLGPATQAIQQLQVGLAELQAYAKARHDLERETALSIRRLESVIAGAHSKGAAGEHILDAVFSRLPPEWQLRNLRVGNRVVEFALRLPNGLALPIDSKWAATSLLEQLEACDDASQRLRLKARIESVVLERAKELRKYIDPNLTANFGVAVVPDAVYDVCGAVHVDAFQHNVAIISYSLFVPYLLLVFQVASRSSQRLDLETLATNLQDAIELVGALQEEVEGRLSKAIAMLGNSRNDLSAQLSRVSSRLVNIQTSAAASSEGGPDHAALGGTT